MRKLWLLPAIVLAVGLNAPRVFAYSYAEAVDPMVKVFQSAVIAARKGKWEEVSRLADKGIAMQKGHIFEADGLAPRFNKTIKDRDISGTAELFANLVYITIREKLHENSKENFSNYKNAKARLKLARKSYIDVLDGNVKKRDKSRSSKILEQFNTALASIGNPGLFGLGKKEPDREGYNRAVEKIESLVTLSFPGFAE